MLHTCREKLSIVGNRQTIGGFELRIDPSDQTPSIIRRIVFIEPACQRATGNCEETTTGVSINIEIRPRCLGDNVHRRKEWVNLQKLIV